MCVCVRVCACVCVCVGVRALCQRMYVRMYVHSVRATRQLTVPVDKRDGQASTVQFLHTEEAGGTADNENPRRGSAGFFFQQYAMPICALTQVRANFDDRREHCQLMIGVRKPKVGGGWAIDRFLKGSLLLAP